jgi:cellulose synthase/poly-beta-1,6-N-acetylglucosamine synthase-like glycosyltransferase
MYKVKQMIEHVHTDIVIITHDDVRFDPDALAAIAKRFNDSPKITMVGANIIAEKAQSQFERIIDVGLRGTATIGQAWRNGDNYLLSNGRCLAFRITHLKKMTIPDNIVNADAYLYFENKRRGGKFAWAREARVFIKNPKHIVEHLRQSRRFLYSKKELHRYFTDEINHEYIVPDNIRFTALVRELLHHPIDTVMYLGILIYANFTQRMDDDARTPLWKVNESTK